MKTNKFLLVASVVSAVCMSATAEVLSRPSGIKIGERMTLRPYVSVSLTYDSNVEAQSGNSASNADCQWTIAPGLGLTYNAENWSLLFSGYYNYRQYFKNCYQNYNNHNYGEDLRWNWSTSTGRDKGWSLIIGEAFRQQTMADDMVLDGGDYYQGDSRQLQLSGALQRRFNEHWHGDLNAGYYWLDYMNDTQKRYSYYGWDRWSVGAEGGFAPSPWTDILLAVNYMGYQQDNLEGTRYDGNSQGWSVQGGLGSYMTERISYRVLAGWSRFEYGDDGSTQNGFVYTITGNWKIGETWNTMLMATSYYQPSERQYASQTRVDSVSWGLAKVMVRGKLRATLDLRYRHELHETINASNYDYNLDIVTGRLGFDYSLNRILAFFLYGEYQRSFNDEADRRNGAYDYDRFRVTAGVRFSY